MDKVRDGQYNDIYTGRQYIICQPSPIRPHGLHPGVGLVGHGALWKHRIRFVPDVFINEHHDLLAFRHYYTAIPPIFKII